MDSDLPPAGAPPYRYWAFISYSSADRKFAKWLHHRLETYRLPVQLVRHATTPTGEPAPQRLKPLFWDRAELSAHHDLGELIENSLRDSRYLIVICSPNSARSHWVDREIRTFRAIHGTNRILTLILDGRPHAKDGTNCFPPALSDFRPKAPDARPRGDGKNNAMLMLLAAMLGVRFDELARRDAQRRKRAMARLGGISAAVITALGTLAFVARDANTRAGIEQSRRRHEEYLVDMASARGLWDQADRTALAALLEKWQGEDGEAIRDFEWRYWRHLLDEPEPQQVRERGVDWRCVALNSATMRLAALDAAGAISLRDLGDGREIRRIPARATSLELTRDGKSLVAMTAADPPGGARRAEPGRVRIWDAVDGGERGDFEPPFLTTSLAVSPDGRWIALGQLDGSVSAARFPSGDDFTVLNTVLRQGIGQTLRVEKHGQVSALAWQDQGGFFASGHADGAVVIWSLRQDPATGHFSHATLESAHTGPVTGIAFHPDGQTVVSQSCGIFNTRQMQLQEGEVMRWTAATGKVSARWRPHGSEPFLPPGWVDSGHGDPERMLAGVGHGAGRFRPAFAPDGRRLFTTGIRGVHAWDPVSGSPLGDTHRSEVPVAALAIDPVGGTLASISGDTLRISGATLRSPTREVSASDRLVDRLALSPDGGTVVVVCESDDGRGMTVGEGGVNVTRSTARALAALPAKAGNGQARLLLAALDRPLSPVVFHDGGRIAACGLQQAEVAGATELPQPPERELPSPKSAQSVTRSSGGSFALMVVPDGDEDRVDFLPLPDGQPRTLCRLATGARVAIRPDDRMAACASRDGKVSLWSLPDGSLRRELTGPAGAITALAFSPDGETLVAGGMDRTLRVWRGEVPAVTLAGHRREISDIAFTPDGRRLVSASGLPGIRTDGPGDVRVWDSASGRLCVELPADRHAIYPGIAVAPDGKSIYAVECDARTGPLAAPGYGGRGLPPSLPPLPKVSRIVCWEAP